MDEIQDRLHDKLTKYRQSLIGASLSQNNWPMADSTIKKIFKERPGYSNSTINMLNMQFLLQRSNWQLNNGDHGAGGAAIVKLIQDARKSVGELVSTKDRVKWQLFEGDVCRSLLDQVETSDKLWEVLSNGTVPDFATLVSPANAKNRDKALHQLEQLTFNSYDHASSECGDIKGKDEIDLRQSVSLALVKFCDHFLRQHEDDGVPLKKEREVYPAVLIDQLLACLQLGFEEDAVQLLPRTMQMFERYPAIKERFVKGARDVPVWMFIKWIPQLVALLDKPEYGIFFLIMSFS